jgi:hypothetical protein
LAILIYSFDWAFRTFVAMQKLFSITLSLLLLLSSSGVSYAKHFCGEFVMMEKVTVGQEQLSCGMAMENDGCEETEETHSCCSNTYTAVDTDDNFAYSDFQFNLQPTFAAAYVAVFTFQSENTSTEKHVFYSEYKPPPLLKDIPVLFETFLI